MCLFYRVESKGKCLNCQFSSTILELKILILNKSDLLVKQQPVKENHKKLQSQVRGNCSPDFLSLHSKETVKKGSDVLVLPHTEGVEAWSFTVEKAISVQSHYTSLDMNVKNQNQFQIGWRG